MATVKRFEDLICWQKAFELTKLIYAFGRQPVFSKDYSFKDQISRAAVSVISNIAEGFERGTRDEFLYFLYIAKGSCAEVRAQLYLAFDQGYISRNDFEKASNLAKEVSGLIYRLIESLKVSKFKGLKFKREIKKEKLPDWLAKHIPEKYRME